MIRIFLNYVLPFLLPAVLYTAYILLHRRFSPNPTPPLREGPWFWIIVAGFVLMAAGLVFVGLSGSEPIQGRYEAPRVEDGKIVPGHVVPAPENR